MVWLVRWFKWLKIPSSFTVSSNTQSIQIDHPYQILWTLLPEDSTNTDIFWNSSDESIATVDEWWLITPVSVWECTITWHTASNWLTQTIAVTTYVVHTTGVELNMNTMTLERWKPQQLIATALPELTNYPEVTWSSSDDSIATVDNNWLVTYVSEWNCIITCTTVDWWYTDTCSITAKVPSFDFYYDFRWWSLAWFQAAWWTWIYTDWSYTIDSWWLWQTWSSNDRNTHAYVTWLNFQWAKSAYIERLWYWISAAWSNGKWMWFWTSYNWWNGFNWPGVWWRINLNTSSPATYSTNWVNYYPNDPVTHYEKYAANWWETTEHLEIDFVNNVCRYILTWANSKTFTINLTEALKQNLFGMTWVWWNWWRWYSSYNSERIRWVKIHIEY